MAISRELTVKVNVDFGANTAGMQQAKREAAELQRMGQGGSGSTGIAAPPMQSPRVRAARDEARAMASARSAMAADVAKESQQALADAARARVDPKFSAEMQDRQTRQGLEQQQRQRELSFRPINRMAGAGGAVAMGLSGIGALTGNQTMMNAGNVVGGATGGMMAGAQIGSMGGPIGTAIGAGVGALAGGITSLVSSLTGGAQAAEKAREAEQRLAAERESAADRAMGAEERRRRMESGESATSGDLRSALGAGGMTALLSLPEELRGTFLEGELARRETRGTFGGGVEAPTGGFMSPALIGGLSPEARRSYVGTMARGGPLSIGDDTGRGTADRLSRGADTAVLREALRSGVSGITRPMDTAGTGFTTGAGIGDRLMESLAARTPAVVAAEKTAEGVDAMKTALEEIRKRLDGGIEEFKPRIGIG